MWLHRSSINKKTLLFGVAPGSQHDDAAVAAKKESLAALWKVCLPYGWSARVWQLVVDAIGPG